MAKFREIVEAEGHLIDSHVMEAVFDKVAEHQASFEVEEFRIGRTNSDASYLRLGRFGGRLRSCWRARPGRFLGESRTDGTTAIRSLSL